MTIERNVKGLLGTKLGMTQMWDDNNRVVPVTVVAASTNVVTQVRKPETDGYNAIQVGFGEIDGRKVTKPAAGQFAKAGVDPAPPPGRDPHRRRRVVRPSGQELAVDTFAAGDEIDVTGTTKGKGFAGVMKRHGFHGVGASHGAHRNHRKPGSIGACATPGRVFKGVRMAGRMGQRHRHHPERHRPRGRRREGPDPAQGRRPRPQGRARCPPLGRQARRRRPRASTKMSQPRSVKVDLPAEIFDAEVNIPLIHQVVVAQQAAARQGTHATKTPRRRPRRWPQALQAEGHRPRPPGLDPRAAVRRRWRRPRPAAAQLRPAHPQEDDGRRPARCPLRPGPRRPHPRRRLAGLRRHAVDQGRARGADRSRRRPRELPAGARALRRADLALAAQRARGAHRGRRPAQHLRRAGLPTTSSSPRAPTTRSSVAPPPRAPPRPRWSRRPRETTRRPQPAEGRRRPDEGRRKAEKATRGRRPTTDDEGRAARRARRPR